MYKSITYNMYKSITKYVLLYIMFYGRVLRQVSLCSPGLICRPTTSVFQVLGLKARTQCPACIMPFTFVYLVCVLVPPPCACGGQRRICQSEFSFHLAGSGD